MKRNTLILFGVGALVLISLGASASSASVYVITDWLIPELEGFSATPYWDVSRWSWGYGTAAPGPTGTITKEQALIDTHAHIAADRAYLAPPITRRLTAKQWAALLSFSYNLGTGNAGNLVPYINAGDDAALGLQWQKYIYAGGVVNSALVARRAREWEVWNS